MAAVKCIQCGAVVTARIVDSTIQLSHGADFMSKCRELVNPLAGDLVSTATECSAMKQTVKRVGARMLAAQQARERRRLARAPVVPSTAVVEPEDDVVVPS